MKAFFLILNSHYLFYSLKTKQKKHAHVDLTIIIRKRYFFNCFYSVQNVLKTASFGNLMRFQLALGVSISSLQTVQAEQKNRRKINKASPFLLIQKHLFTRNDGKAHSKNSIQFSLQFLVAVTHMNYRTLLVLSLIHISEPTRP